MLKQLQFLIPNYITKEFFLVNLSAVRKIPNTRGEGGVLPWCNAKVLRREGRDQISSKLA